MDQCRFREATCHSCHKTSHLAQVCRGGQAHGRFGSRVMPLQMGSNRGSYQHPIAPIQTIDHDELWPEESEDWKDEVPTLLEEPEEVDAIWQLCDVLDARSQETQNSHRS